MRKLIYAINLTLDGCCDHTKVMPSKEVFEYHLALLQDAGTLLYGRITYQLMVPYWPDVAKNPAGKPKLAVDFAQAFDAVRDMVVISKSIEKVDEEKTRIISTNLHDEILALKQEPGKNILMGGADIPSQLMQLGLVDEFHFVVQPMIAGEGRRLFNNVTLQERQPLKLVESKVFESGHVGLQYAKG